MSFSIKKMMSVLRQNHFDNNGQRITLLHYDDKATWAGDVYPSSLFEIF